MKKNWQDYVFNPIFRIAVPLALFVVGTICTTMYIFSRPVLFESTAKLWVQAKPAQSLLGQQNTFYPLVNFFNSPIVTASEVMKSSVVISAAIDSLHQTLPASKCPTLNDMRGILQVNPVKDTDVLEVSYKSGDPKVAYQVVDAMLGAFVRVTAAQSAGSAVQSRVFLERQQQIAKQEYQDARRKLRTFQEDHQAVNLEEETTSLLEQASSLNEELRQAQVALGEANSQEKSIIDQLGLTQAQATDLDRLAQDDMLIALRQKLAEQQLRLIDVKAKSPETSLRVKKLTAAIEKTKAAIAAKIGDGKNPDMIPTKGDRRLKSIEQLSELRRDIAAKQQTIATISRSIGEVNSKLQTVPVKQVQFSELNRAEKVTGETLSEVEKNLSSARLSESVASDSSNVQIIDRPQIPEHPESAGGKKILMIAEGLLSVLAVALFLALKLLDPHVYSGKQAVRILNSQILGWVEKLRGDGDAIHPLNRLRLTLNGWLGKKTQSLIVLSANADDGKSTISLGLARSYANAGVKVLLVDADFISASLDQKLNAKPGAGLTDAISARDPNWNNYVQKINDNLLFLPAGRKTNSGVLLEGDSLKSLLNYSEESCDVVIFDTAPIGDSETAVPLLHQANKALLVVRLSHTRISALKVLAKFLKKLDLETAVVLNDANAQDFVAADTKQSDNDGSNDLVPAW